MFFLFFFINNEPCYQYEHPYGSMSQLTETSSDTFRSSLPESDRNYFNQGCQLTIHSGK